MVINDLRMVARFLILFTFAALAFGIKHDIPSREKADMADPLSEASKSTEGDWSDTNLLLERVPREAGSSADDQQFEQLLNNQHNQQNPANRENDDQYDRNQQLELILGGSEDPDQDGLFGWSEDNDVSFEDLQEQQQAWQELQLPQDHQNNQEHLDRLALQERQDPVHQESRPPANQKFNRSNVALSTAPEKELEAPKAKVSKAAKKKARKEKKQKRRQLKAGKKAAKKDAKKAKKSSDSKKSKKKGRRAGLRSRATKRQKKRKWSRKQSSKGSEESKASASRMKRMTGQMAKIAK